MEDVSDWAQKVLNFDDEEMAVLQKAKFNGRRLLRVCNKKGLIDPFTLGTALELWAAIEEMKKPHDNNGNDHWI